MSGFFATRLGVPLQEFLSLPRDRAAALVRSKIPDLLHLLDHEPSGRTRDLASGLEQALIAAFRPEGAALQNLCDRIITDDFMRSELDRDQNVYLGHTFTRVLTRAVPDVVFQPASPRELEIALAWARGARVGVTTRGAGTTAMGGAVPNDGGLLLELSRFDEIHVDEKDQVATIGAGARLKQIHARLADHGMALKTYPSNLGGTLAGWFSAGGLGLNSFAHGPVQNQVRALSVVLPRGEHVRFHDDGRLDVLSPESHRFEPSDGQKWLASRAYTALDIAAFAQSEGQLGVIVALAMAIEPKPDLTPFFAECATEANAFAFVEWILEEEGKHGWTPSNLKFLSAAHVAAVRTLRGSKAHAHASVYVDFATPEAAARFRNSVDPARHHLRLDDAEARAWHADRFRPQQTKRLGPGFLAAEILMPAAETEPFQSRAVRLAARVGVHLETEIYFFGDGRALALPGYLTRGPRPGFTYELLLAPILLDLAMRRHGAKPYVLGRWQSPYFRFKHGADERRRMLQAKKSADAKRSLNAGVFFAPVFKLPFAQGMFKTNFPAGVRFLRGLYGSPLTAPFFRAAIGAAGGEHPALPGSTTASPAGLALSARGCVNCGECNSVCPIFHDAKIRLPQMLTHLGENLRQRGGTYAGTPQLLLDLCMRCGNCAEVCQADIPHLDLYEAMEKCSGKLDTERRERHTAVVSHLRHSDRYTRQFLGVRPGGYLVRTPASLPGEVRFVLFRAENDAGPSDTCIHCGACVPVCPTNANLEFQEEADPRRITTDLAKCIGCGTCVEVCPANDVNGGRTLRVMEAPARVFFDLMADFERRHGGNGDATARSEGAAHEPVG